MCGPVYSGPTSDIVHVWSEEQKPVYNNVIFFALIEKTHLYYFLWWWVPNSFYKWAVSQKQFGNLCYK